MVCTTGTYHGSWDTYHGTLYVLAHYMYQWYIPQVAKHHDASSIRTVRAYSSVAK